MKKHVSLVITLLTLFLQSCNLTQNLGKYNYHVKKQPEQNYQTYYSP